MPTTSRLLHTGSDILLRPAKRILLLYLGVVAGILYLLALTFRFLHHNFDISYIGLGRLWLSIGIIGFGFLCYAFLWRITCEYVISIDRITSKTGILSRRHIHIPLGRVIDYRLMRPIMERLLGLGSLHIDTAGNDEEIVMQQISEHELAAAGLRLDELLENDNQKDSSSTKQGT